MGGRLESSGIQPGDLLEAGSPREAAKGGGTQARST